MTNDPLTLLIKTVVEVLAKAKVKHAITGSVASSIHGEPIVSRDIDFVVRMSPEQARIVANSLPERFYRSEETLVEAAHSHGFANLVDMDTSLKIDLSVLSPDPFHDAIFTRSKPVPFAGGAEHFYVVSAEDIVLMKLQWRQQTQSAKQWSNALSVVRTHGARLDWAYLLSQAQALNLYDELVSLREEAGV